MRFSVIIPAHNAASTLIATLDSVTSQTFAQVEVIVVDDGSTDGSGKIAKDYALHDPRISVRRIRRGGTSVARNEGLRLARNEWILFLDADDIIFPRYLEKVEAEVCLNPEVGAVYVGWEYFNADGKSWQLPTPELNQSDLFPTLARYCPFVVHSCVVTTRLAREVGGFDPGLVHAEDWDFWQRIARTNTKFKGVPEVLASYRVGQMSESTKTTRVLKYNACVLKRGHSADSRIRNPIPRYANGMPRIRMPSALLSLVAWMAGLVIGQQLDFQPLLRYVRRLDVTAIDPEAVAWALFLAIARSKGLPTEEWSTFESTVMPDIERFLHCIEKKSGAPGLSRRVGRLLEDLIIDTRTSSEAVTVGRTYVVPVPIDMEIPDVIPGGEVERIRCLIKYKNQNVGEFLLPVCDGRVPAAIISDTIATNHYWKILALFFQSHIYPKCSQFPSSNGIDIWRNGVFLGSTDNEYADNFWDRAHEDIGWTVFLQELWGHEDWGLHQFYDALSPVDDSAPVPFDSAISEPCFDICHRLTDMQTGSPHIDALIVAAGIPLSRIRIPVREGVIRAGAIRATINDEIGRELIRVVVRDVIIGRSFEDKPVSIHTRLIRLGEERRTMRDDSVACETDTWHPFWYGSDQPSAEQRTTVVGRRNPHTIFGSDMRRVRLPVAAEESVLKAAVASGRPCLCTNLDRTGARTLISAPELIASSRQSRDGNSFPDAVDSPATGNSDIATIPILAYPHRPRRLPDGSSRDPVTPDQFEQNMHRLQELGYRSVRLSELSAAMACGRPLAGKVVIITIDELNDDLLSQSWATLRRFGFSATLFVDTDSIHPTSRLKSLIFRRRISARAKLLGRLRSEGLEFGSFTASARPLTWLSHFDVVSEAARSFTTLVEDSYASLPAIAYPMCQCDAIVEHLIAGCGYSFGLTGEARPCAFTDRPMALPRFQITAKTSEGLFDEYLESVSLPEILTDMRQ